MHARTTILLVAVMLNLTGLASAQQTTGTISGRILDVQELPVPGVTVTATGPQGSRVSVTDAEGRYTVPFLIPGRYTVRAELQGFKTAEVGNVNVSTAIPDSTELTDVEATRPRWTPKTGH
jgi:Carboxypeptidase regulatory-like domain